MLSTKISLAIEQQTVVSPGKTVSEMENVSSRATDVRCVTLLVDSRQANALQLAMEQGVLSLALRNPLDATGAWVRFGLGLGIAVDL